MESESIYSGLSDSEIIIMKQLLAQEDVGEEYFLTPLTDDEITNLRHDKQNLFIMQNEARLQRRIEYFKEKPTQIEAVRIWMSCRENDITVSSLVMRHFLEFLESKIEASGGRASGDIYREDLKLIFIVDQYMKHTDISSIEDACIKIVGLEKSNDAEALARKYYRKKKEFKKLGLPK